METKEQYKISSDGFDDNGVVDYKGKVGFLESVFFSLNFQIICFCKWPPPTSTDLRQRPPTSASHLWYPPPPTSATDLHRPSTPTSATGLRPPPPTSDILLRWHPPPTSTDIGHRPPISASFLRPPPPTSASDLRLWSPPPTSASELWLHPKYVNSPMYGIVIDGSCPDFGWIVNTTQVRWRLKFPMVELKKLIFWMQRHFATLPLKEKKRRSSTEQLEVQLLSEWV